MQLDIICRVCLKEGPMKSIFSTQKTDGEQKVYCSDMLMACAAVTVTQGDGFPEKICVQCFKKLCSAFKFKKLCEKSFSCLLECSAKNFNIDEIKKEKIEEIEVEQIFNSNEISLKNNDVLHQDCDLVKEEILLKDEKKLSTNNNLEDDSSFIEDFLPSPKYESDEEYIVKKKHRKKIKLNTKKKKLANDVTEKPKRKRKVNGFTCSFCPKVFRRMYLLIPHQDSHMGIKRYFCELCKKTYRSEKDHKKMHKRGFNFKCEICSKVFNTKAKLTIHTATHNENRVKLICGLNGCTKEFISLGGLDRHRSSHDGLKNFICHLCSKRFIDKYQLASHIRRHNNERRFSCNFCDKRFYESSGRIAHERRHTNTKNYPCTQCDKSFVCSTGLRRHLLCHNKEAKEACRFCGKRFSRCDNRKRHEVVMHGVSGHTAEHVS